MSSTRSRGRSGRQNGSPAFQPVSGTLTPRKAFFFFFFPLDSFPLFIVTLLTV